MPKDADNPIISLQREVEAAKILRAQFADIIAGDEEAAADFIEGETNLHEAIGVVVERISEDMALCDGLKSYIDKFSNRLDRLNKRIASMKTAVQVAMEQAGKKKLEHPIATLSVRSVPQSVIVSDESAIPSKFWVPAPPKLDKAALKNALKDGASIEGASLNNGGSTVAITWR